MQVHSFKSWALSDSSINNNQDCFHHNDSSQKLLNQTCCDCQLYHLISSSGILKLPCSYLIHSSKQFTPSSYQMLPVLLRLLCYIAFWPIVTVSHQYMSNFHVSAEHFICVVMVIHCHAIEYV